jgi:hypothetical protein
LPSSNANHFYHLEYYPYPGSEQFKIDCITYGLGAKVTHGIGANHLSEEIIQIHTHENVSWVVFNRDHLLATETDTDLKVLFDHKVEVKLTDDRMTVSKRAKHEKPKG